MSRRTMADRKRRAADRKARRESLFVTLARLDRGVITNAERPLLREAVEAEIIESDDLRSTIDGLQRALQAALRRAEAAEEAIVEAEQDRDEQRGNYLSACATIAAMHEAAVGEVTGPARGVVEDVADVRAAIERVKALAAMLRSESHPFGMHAHFADRIEQALDGEQPADVPDVRCWDGERGPDWNPIDGNGTGRMVGILGTALPAAAEPCPTPETHNWGCGCPTDHSAHIMRAQAAEQRAEDAEQAARTAIENHQEAEQRLKHAHQARRDKVGQLDEIRRALCDIGYMDDDDAYSHADLADVIRQAYAGDQERMKQVDDKADQQFNDVANAARKFKAWGEEQARRAEQADAVTAETKRLMERRTNTLRQRAERVEAELAAARTHAAEQGKTIARLLREVGDAEQQAADMRKAYTDADALATLRTHQRDEARATLRATENDLAGARRRLADQAEPCPGPTTAEPNHPIFPLYRALTIDVALDDDRANELIRAYCTAIHDKFCTRTHEEPRP